MVRERVRSPAIAAIEFNDRLVGAISDLLSDVLAAVGIEDRHRRQAQGIAKTKAARGIEFVQENSLK